LDRFNEGKLDAQDTSATTTCADCGGELYLEDIAYCCTSELICEKCFCNMLKIIEEECRVYVYK